MTATISFLLAITIIVFVHEFGHYIFARLCGVKVLRFSIGFGTPLISKYDSNGTEWVISAIPLGGYVTMWDHQNPNHYKNKNEIKNSFSSKNFLQRILIVFGGPLANFFFAILAFTFIFSFDQKKTSSIIDEPIISSLAHQIGLKKHDKVVALNSNEIKSFEDIDNFFKGFQEFNKKIEITFLRDNFLQKRSFFIDENELINEEFFAKKLGFLPKSSGVMILGTIHNSIASNYGLEKGDIIYSIDGKEVNFPNEITEILKNNSKNRLKLTYYKNINSTEVEKIDIRDTEELVIKFERSDQVLGVYLAANTEKNNSSLTIDKAFQNALSQTFKIIDMCLTGIYKIFTGSSPFEQISGPISIANAAQNSVNSGILPFLAFLSVLSISIGVINLLPIPVLDGGHILYYTIELIKGSPLSDNFKLAGTWFGLIFIFGITVLAISNDLLMFLKL